MTHHAPRAARPAHRARAATSVTACALLVAVATVAAVATTAPREAHAQPSPGGRGAASAARRAFERGVDALQAGRYSDALSELLESQRLRPATIVLYNLGLAYRGLGRYRDAIRSFREYLAAPDRGNDAQRVAAVRTEIDELGRRLVAVRLDVRPAGATVTVDGRTEAISNGALTLDPGERLVEISAEGYRSYRERIRLRSEVEASMIVRLEPASIAGRLAVTASASDARITVDGALAGTGRAELYLPAGEHVVEARASGYRPFRRAVRVGSSGLVRVDATLAPLPRPLPPGIIAAIVVSSVVVVGTVIAITAVATAAPPAYPASWINVEAIQSR